MSQHLFFQCTLSKKMNKLCDSDALECSKKVLLQSCFRWCDEIGGTFMMPAAHEELMSLFFKKILTQKHWGASVWNVVVVSMAIVVMKLKNWTEDMIKILRSMGEHEMQGACHCFNQMNVVFTNLPHDWVEHAHVKLLCADNVRSNVLPKCFV